MMSNESHLQIVPASNVEILPVKADPIRDEIKKLSHEISAKFLRLAQLLRVVHKDRLYLDWGFDSFEAWATGDTDLHPETARTFVNLEKTLVEEAHIPRETLAEIGWTKAKPMISLAKQGKLEPKKAEILEKAKELPTNQFQDYVNQVRAGAEGENMPAPRASVAFFLTPDQQEVITRARCLAEGLTNSMDPGSQLVAICQEFIGSVREDDAQAPDAWRARRVASILDVLSNQFGLEIEISGARTDAGRRVRTALLQTRRGQAPI